MQIYTKIFCVAIALIVASANVFAATNKKQPKPKKMANYEFGVGVPLMTPLTGYNVFVGYVNKKADSFWGRRFGIRADFTIPSNLRLTGTVSDKTNLGAGEKPKYIVDAHGKVMGFNVKSSDFKDKPIEIDAIKDDKKQPISIGQDGVDLSLNIKNKNMGILIDFYPFADTWFLGGIRFSGGYYLGDFQISANAIVNNDINYDYEIKSGKPDTLHAQIARGSRIGADYKWKYHGPYAGMGFDLGIWRGFKFFMDAGVVFSDAPKITNKNIHDDDFYIRGRYEIRNSDGSIYSSGSNMVDIISGGSTAPDVDHVVQEAVGMVAQETLNTYASQYSGVIAQIPGFENVDYSTLGADVLRFLNDEGTEPWISELVNNYAGTKLTDTLNDIKSEWEHDAADAKKGIQNDINKAWNDYNKAKNDAIKDANDVLHKYGMMPMIKFGFMYRF